MGSTAVARRLVVHFNEYTSKRMVCEAIGVDYDCTYAKCYYYRQATPIRFARHVFVEHLSPETFSQLRHVPRRLYEQIDEQLSGDARLRCVQIAAEYAAIIYRSIEFLKAEFDSEESMREVLKALQQFYDPAREGDTCWWLHETLKRDLDLFTAIHHRIRSMAVGPTIVLGCKRAMHYQALLTGRSEADRIYLDSQPVPLTVLTRIQRAYEHVLMSRYPVDDMTNPNAPLQVLCRSSNFYQHSGFNEPERGKMLIHIDCDNGEFSLLLHDGKKKRTHMNAYATALEMIVGPSSPLYCDRRLGHNYWSARDGVGVFWVDESRGADIPVSASLPNSDAGRKALFKRIEELTRHEWRIVKSLQEHHTPQPCDPHVQSKMSTPCKRLDLLHEGYEDDACERDRALLENYVFDLLLGTLATRGGASIDP